MNEHTYTREDLEARVRAIEERHEKELKAKDELKNLVLQQAARYLRRSSSGYMLFVATVRSFKEKGRFEKVEFG